MEAYQRQIGGKVYIIDIIRCIACLMIFFYHCNSLLPGEYKFLTFFGEDMGNDLFFMLSGFSLYPSIESTPPLELPAWYARRVKRILPMLALFYILSFLTGYYSFKSPQQLFTVFIYPTLYWFATGILVFYLLLFLLMKARPKAVRWIFVAALMPIWILRSDRMEGYYLIGFISMVAGCILREFLERRIRLRAEMPGSLSENQFTQSARPHFAGESDANLGYVARYAPQIRSVPPQTGDAHLGQSVFGQAPGKLKLLSGLVLFGMVYIISKYFKFTGHVTTSIYFIIGLSVLATGIFALTFGYLSNDALKGFFEGRKRLAGLIRYIGSLALPVYLVQCFNSGLIGFTIGQRISFPKSFAVNLIVVWGAAIAVERLTGYLTGRLERRN